MKHTILIAGFAILLSAAVTAHSANDAMTLMEESHLAFYYAADGGSSRVTMVMTDKKGRTRSREFWMIRRDVADMGDQRYYTYFIKPGDIARTAFLVHKKAKGSDNRWLYIPALDLVKRIASDDRRGSFVGSDFTYEDVSGRLPLLDTHEIIGADSAMGRSATKVKSTPIDKKTADYIYRMSWIDDATKLVLREEYFDKKDKLVRIFAVERIETIEDIPTAVVRTMTNIKKKRSTTITFSEVTYANPLAVDKFNERLLKNPPAEFTR